MEIATPKTLDDWNAAGGPYLPGYLGFEFDEVSTDKVIGRMPIESHHLVWNGFLHAGALVTLADTCCGYGTVANLPQGASGFTTVELKTNFLATLRQGEVRCIATPLHRGRTTQVWDAVLEPTQGGKPLAHFRCTQMILWPRA